MDFTYVVANSNDQDVTICPGYYSIGEIIAILNTMTDIMFFISTKDSRYGCIWIQFHTLSISPMPQILEKSPICQDEESFYLLRSMGGT